jgi:2-(1,2-epoxy-1,2-dihydrophenyl)acetyl-CoA isomerase
VERWPALSFHSSSKIKEQTLMNDPVLTQRHGNILEISLNRPEAYNALNLDMMKMLGEILSSAAVDGAIQGILITGNGKAFCSGGDLKWISQQTEEAGTVLYKLAPQFHLAIIEIHRMENPSLPPSMASQQAEGFRLP